MRDQPRGSVLAVSCFILGCGALAESSQQGSSGGSAAPCASSTDCTDEAVGPSAGAQLGEGSAGSDPGAAARVGEGPRPPGESEWSDEGPRRAPSSCPDGVVHGSLEIGDQMAIDRLVGCVRIEGALLLHLFEGIDEQPLLSLQDIDGSLTVEGDRPIPDPLIGFLALEEVTDLLLDGLTLPDLRRLSRLRRIGTETSSSYPLPPGTRDKGGLEIRNSSGLTSLAGLDSLESAHWIVLEQDPELVSLTGAPRLQSLQKLSSTGCPLADLNGSGELGLEELRIGGSALLDLSSLGGASALKRLGLDDNEQLLSLRVAQLPAQLESLSLSGNPLLVRLEGLEALESCDLLALYSSPALVNLESLSRLRTVGDLELSGTGVENLDALSSLVELHSLLLRSNLGLRQIDGLSNVTGLTSLDATGNSALEHLPTFGALTDACDTCGFELLLEDNLSLQSGPGLPGIARGGGLLIANNPALTSLAGLGALRSVESLQVEQNPALVELGLPLLAQASSLVVHGNAVLDDTQLSSLRGLPPPAVVKIASNASGASRFDPCPWPADGVCDEIPGDCAIGSDAADCPARTP